MKRLREPSECQRGFEANSIETEFLLMLLMEPPAQTAQRFVSQAAPQTKASADCYAIVVQYLEM